LRDTEDWGVHLVARRHFECGDKLLSEEPLLRMPDASPIVRRTLEQNLGHHASFMMPALCVDWESVDEEEREAILTLFFAHPLMAGKSGDQAYHACDALWRTRSELQRMFSTEELFRFLHIVDLNIHRDDEHPQNANFTGIFIFGSKFSHSCAPNCSWSFDRSGRLQYHAVRPIKAGELLTFSYVGNGMNLLVSTLDRRRRLSCLCFVCRCSRCSGPDLSRKMRCPSCKDPGGCLPLYDDLSEPSPIAPGGAMTPAMEADAPCWQCEACGKVFKPQAMPLADESELAELVPKALTADASEELASGQNQQLDLRRLASRAARSLGPRHWTHILASFGWLRLALVQLRTEPVIYWSEEELQLASRIVASWLQVSTPDNADQRMSALFLAMRLAHDLGGTLSDWGYDAKDPLGGGLKSLERLQEHGFRLASDGSVLGPERGEEEEERRGSNPQSGR